MKKKLKQNDSLESFFKKNSDITMFVDAFDAICGTDFEKRFGMCECADISPMLMFAYLDLQLVWKDVLQQLENPSQPCAVIEIIESKPEKSHPSDRFCNSDMLYQTKCSFKYKSNSFSVKYCKRRGWGMYLENEI